jgi:hypothetical protein
LRPPAWARYLSLIGTLILGFVSAVMLGFAVLFIVQRWWWLGLFIGALACFMAALTGYVMRDLRGKWGLRVELLPDGLSLHLPAGRSLIHRPPAQDLTIPYQDIGAIETRLEGYPSLGMEILQRPYVLSLKSGDRIFLFEDRAFATGLETPMVEKIAAAIVSQAHVPLRDLGMVEGRGGFLAVWGTHAPDWAAPSLPLQQQMRIWRHSAWTGLLAAAVLMLAYGLSVLGY